MIAEKAAAAKASLERIEAALIERYNAMDGTTPAECAKADQCLEDIALVQSMLRDLYAAKFVGGQE